MASQKHTHPPQDIQEIPDERICHQCKLSKPLTDFYKDKNRKYGHKYECKLCDNARVIDWQRTNPERHSATVRKYNRGNQEKMREKCRKNYSKNRIRRIADAKRYAQDNPEKVNAHSAVYRAMESGKLIRPNKCSKCAISCRPEGHHNSYLPEHWLDVVWLCNSCHQLFHIKKRPQSQ